MKRLASILFATAALSLSASAATVTSNCTAFPIQFGSSVGSGSVTCAAFSGALGTLTGTSLALVADYTFGTGASNDIKLTFTIGAPAGVTWASSSSAIDVLGGFNSSSTVPGLPVNVAATAGVTNANFASAFNVGVSSSVVSGGAGTSSAGVTVTYTYTSPVPEPASMALMGSALAGLAVFARKRAVR